MNSMLEDFPSRNSQNFSKAKSQSAPERASKSPETVRFLFCTSKNIFLESNQIIVYNYFEFLSVKQSFATYFQHIFGPKL
jgi:hypothetical protein